jgi:hypothetical protein
MFFTPTNSSFIVVVSFLIWRVVSRIRRHIGRQPLRPVRMTFRIVFLSLATLGLAAVEPHETNFMLGLGGGLLAGVLLAILGLHLTQFENTSEGYFFTPNMYVGITISLLLVGRLGYQMIRYKHMAEQHRSESYSLVQSPLTLLLFGLLAGYYIAYYIGVFFYSHRLSDHKTNA